MCGIAGWIDWEVDLTRERSVVEAMGASLACRGPDAAGVWVSRRAALAHRRLIVVDPAGGGQPMVRRRGDRTFVITYNGELYNTAELRRDLEAHGYRFRGYSDTEALLLAFMAWGPDCLERLNGIFAFAVWDEAGETLFLARDRLGVKPLFYAPLRSGLLFGSEPKALLASGVVRPRVDAEGLAEVLVMGPGRTPGHAVFRDIAELKPGHRLLYDRRGVRMQRYWGLRARPHPDDPETTVAGVRELLRDAVERQLVSDVPVCTLLSGGLDSSAVTALAAAAYRRNGAGPVSTFSVDYAGNDRHFRPDEFQPHADGPWVRRVSGLLGTRHREVVLETAALVEALPAVVAARDLPGMADVDASLYLFCREVKREATVALSGEAADEVFGGYPWFRRPEDLRAATFPWMRLPDQRMALLAPDLVRCLRPLEYATERYREALAEVPRLAGEDPLDARLREIAYLGLTRFLPVLLERKDRMSMAWGLEVRVPYCDHRLVEYVWNVPWSWKNAGGREKGLLRRALEGILPPDVLARRKNPYPKTHHPAYAAAVRGRCLALLEDPSSPLRPLLDVRAVRALAEGAGGGVPWFGQLMAGPQLLAYLIQVDCWLRTYRVEIRL
ncbi:MAG: asparagine synthase (glutamine-hydrolyzing) [Desulfotomaculales bacterium]